MINKYSFAFAKNGMNYQPPTGLSEEKFSEMLDELLTFCKIKGLTVTQAQLLFKTCEEYVSDTTLV